MTITVNGDAAELDAGGTVRTLLAALGLPDTGIAVAVDGAVLPRRHWDTALSEGAEVEVVTAVQGG
ncbi:sulfur carrier protein ThiS [Gordonia desulfuricans]|uniref:Sulfur carrier protein ThiS n=1 Tax=Gordonia desulfuricans TaxID=89051 RepID=A0A7K3LLP1_9ACTN|nr:MULTISPECIES: sulfur carrier protein ThiS [Gordonia]KOY49998.1 thiamine biosynthesis protein ThiS [Gordonia sp. NB41Y]NDK89172.1 sulfur carrier protein ThiS [Gordonia desulfuricans]WLP88982.1 sulfur carrier protein ThiS [Gordonia sp. NB41Y]